MTYLFLSLMGPLDPYLTLPYWPLQPPLQPQLSSDLSHFQGHCATVTSINASPLLHSSPQFHLLGKHCSKFWRTEVGSL